jgi:exodeoxyribonuclease VII large subunit
MTAMRDDRPPSRLGSDEPPAWALPAWDAIGAPGQGPAAPRAPTNPPGTFGLRILNVSDVARAIREAVRADERLRDVWVEGEVGRVTISSAGHAYFTLKDERAQLQCVWFRDDRLSSPFEPQAGLRVVAHGRIDLFEPQGALQLYVEALQPAGFGDLALRFEALKARLAAEGLFDRSRKRPLPTRPATIAVVTSPSGAVWHDIQTVLRRRWPLARIVMAPCVVQGDAAPGSIVGALRRVSRWADRCRAEGRPEDAPVVTILARGGGSLEDLWSFNDERVVRAVVGHPVPVVCGVGHETDVSLADFAADVRAPTPSAAAELVVPDRLDALATVRADGRRLAAAMSAQIEQAHRLVTAEGRALERLSPTAQLAIARERVGLLLDRATRSVLGLVAERRMVADRLARRLAPILPARLEHGRGAVERSSGLLPRLAVSRLTAGRASLDAAGAALAVLGPQGTLDRGYAIVRRSSDGRVVRDPADAPVGAPLAIRVARGELAATVVVDPE